MFRFRKRNKDKDSKKDSPKGSPRNSATPETSSPRGSLKLPEPVQTMSESPKTGSPMAVQITPVVVKDKICVNHPTGEGHIRDHYVIGSLLGKGAFSEVYEGVHKVTKEKWAIKTIKKKMIKRKLLEREIEIMTKVKHPNILSAKEVFETDDHIYLVLELVHGGELYDKIVDDGEFSEDEAKIVVAQMLIAVEYLHQVGIAHRDMKPENILCMDKKSRRVNNVRQERIKLADFGLSKIFVAEDLTSQCGSPTYVAPEVLMSKKPYDKQVDMWAVGVITFVILTGCFPFYEEGKNYGALYQKIINVDYYFPEEPKISAEGKGFIKSLLVRDPEKRLNPAQAREHPWLKGVVVPSMNL